MQETEKCMNEKTGTIKKSVPGKIVASKKQLTPLQTVAIGMLMTVLMFASISSMVTYSSNKKPSKNIFNNSQTIHVLPQ